MKYQIRLEKKDLQGKIILPASKSISNRLLVMNALSGNAGTLENLSESDDTHVLIDALRSKEGRVDVGHAGTAMRFLTAYLCTQPGKWFLTGSARMKQRPIAKLVDALKQLGAGISYTGETGFPPLHIEGKKLGGGRISVDSSISSQYISALMMIAPALEGGLTIRLEKDVVSSSYINLTKCLMQDMGVPVDFRGPVIEIPQGPYQAGRFRVEGDWSAASYWYAMAALADDTELEIAPLLRKSYQGDSVLPEIFAPLGVTTHFSDESVILGKAPRTSSHFEYHFGNNPDLVQTLVLVCSLLGIPFRMTGTSTLRIKETDRISALQSEMRKLGFHLDADEKGDWISWDGSVDKDTASGAIETSIRTYQDHRMGMAFAPAAMFYEGLCIEDPDVVNKSYPGFWEDLRKVGFTTVSL